MYMGWADASREGDVAFLDVLLCEGLLEKAGSVGVEGKEEGAAGGAIEAVDGVDVLADLVACTLKGKGVALVPTTVDGEAGGLVDGDEILVLKEDLERGQFAHVGDGSTRGEGATLVTCSLWVGIVKKEGGGRGR